MTGVYRNHLSSLSSQTRQHQSSALRVRPALTTVITKILLGNRTKIHNLNIRNNHPSLPCHHARVNFRGWTWAVCNHEHHFLLAGVICVLKHPEVICLEHNWCSCPNSSGKYVKISTVLDSLQFLPKLEILKGLGKHITCQKHFFISDTH